MNRAYDVVNLTVANGTALATEGISLREGRCVGIIVTTDGTDKANNNILSLGIKQGNKGYVIEPLSLDLYKFPANGFEGVINVNFDGGQRVYPEITGIKNVAADTNLQVVFVIDETTVN